MKLTNQTIEALSEKFARQFTYRMPSAAHLLADLKQEAAIAIVLRAPEWKSDGGANLETYTRWYAWRAMQELCTKQSGPVSKPMALGKYEGTVYSVAGGVTTEREDRANEYLSSACNTPDEMLARKEADEIVRDFIERRASRFSGKGKLSIETIKSALHDLISGDSCTEIGERYGCSKQHISMLAAQAEIA